MTNPNKERDAAFLRIRALAIEAKDRTNAEWVEFYFEHAWNASRNAAIDEFVRRATETAIGFDHREGGVLTVGNLQTLAAEMKGESNE